MSEAGTVTLEQVVSLARQLPPLEKIRLVEQIAPEIERDCSSNDRSGGGHYWVSAPIWDRLRRPRRLMPSAARCGPVFHGMVYLAEKGRIDATALDRLTAELMLLTPCW